MMISLLYSLCRYAWLLIQIFQKHRTNKFFNHHSKYLCIIVREALSKKESICIAKVSLLFSFMNWCKMFVHVTLLRTAVVTSVTSVTLEWLFSFMNMVVQISLLRKAVVTNVTFECFFFLHEQMQHEFSCYPFENMCSHKCHI